MKLDLNDTILGFTSFSDFFQTLFGFKYKFQVWLISFFGAMTSFITSYIYDDAKAVYIMLILYLADFATAVYRAHKLEKIQSRRLPRVFVIMTIGCALLALGWHMASVSDLFVFLPGAIWNGIVSTQFLSIIENLQDVGLVEGKWANQIKNLFSTIINKSGKIIQRKSKKEPKKDQKEDK